MADPNAPTIADDPFSRANLTDPYPLHEKLRAAGPVVWLERYGIWGLARHEQVHAVLNNWETFISSAGVGLSDFRKEKPWRPPSLLLEADPPLHTRTRGVITKVLSRRALNEMRETFTAQAEKLVDELLERKSFDAIQDLAKAFPLKVFPDAVGIGAEGREHLLPYGNMAFNAFGPHNELLAESLAQVQPVSAWIMSQCRRDVLRPGALGAQIFAAADAGSVSDEEAALLVRSLLTAGVDTTVNGIGNTMVCLTRHPEAWRALHADPSLARAAFEESIRVESPVQTFFRTTSRPIEIAGVALGEGEKVLTFLGAANRDPLRWKDAHRYDLTRNAAGHVGFGAGIHGCVGQMIARLEGEVLLTAFARRAKSIEPTGEAVPRLNNTLRGWESLPVTVSA